MTDSPRDLSDLTGTPGSEALARLLSALCPDDEEEASRRYCSLQAKLVGFFQMKGVSDPTSAADEVIDRAGRRISEGALVPNVNNYCLGIARNVLKERLRKGRRESSAFLAFAGDFNEGLVEELERIYSLFKPCFERLGPKDQQLLRAYYQALHGRARAEHRRQLADEMQTSQKALRIRITRLRQKLWECVRVLSKRD
jgi:DNA-directed RNA polymerase specialized sigma24 family protein